MQSPPSELIDRIVPSEGLNLVAYRDPVGILTVGIGHSLSTPITAHAAHVILLDDLATASEKLDAALPWAQNLDPVRYWTLVELAFNMGVGVSGGSHGLLSFTHALEAIKDHRWMNASQAFLQSKWADEVGDVRAERIAKQIQTGAWA